MGGGEKSASVAWRSLGSRPRLGTAALPLVVLGVLIGVSLWCASGVGPGAARSRARLIIRCEGYRGRPVSGTVRMSR